MEVNRLSGNQAHLVCGIAVPNDKFTILGGTDEESAEKGGEKKKGNTKMNSSLSYCVGHSEHKYTW